MKVLFIIIQNLAVTEEIVTRVRTRERSRVLTRVEALFFWVLRLDETGSLADIPSFACLWRTDPISISHVILIAFLAQGRQVKLQQRLPRRTWGSVTQKVWTPNLKLWELPKRSLDTYYTTSSYSLEHNCYQGRIQKIQKEGAETLTLPQLRMKTSLFRTCSNKVTSTFQKHFENTRNKGGRGPLGPSPKSAYGYSILLRY